MAVPVMRAAADVLDLLGEGVAALALSVGDAFDPPSERRPVLHLVVPPTGTERDRGARAVRQR